MRLVVWLRIFWRILATNPSIFATSGRSRKLQAQAWHQVTRPFVQPFIGVANAVLLRGLLAETRSCLRRRQACGLAWWDVSVSASRAWRLDASERWSLLASTLCKGHDVGTFRLQNLAAHEEVEREPWWVSARKFQVSCDGRGPAYKGTAWTGRTDEGHAEMPEDHRSPGEAHVGRHCCWRRRWAGVRHWCLGQDLGQVRSDLAQWRSSPPSALQLLDVELSQPLCPCVAWPVAEEAFVWIWTVHFCFHEGPFHVVASRRKRK